MNSRLDEILGRFSNIDRAAFEVHARQSGQAYEPANFDSDDERDPASMSVDEHHDLALEHLSKVGESPDDEARAEHFEACARQCTLAASKLRAPEVHGARVTFIR